MDVQSKITDIDEITKKIEIVIPAAQIDSKCAERLTRVMKSATIKGFRKGKAPKNVVEQLYSNDIFLETVWDEIEKIVRDEIKKNNLKSVAQPDVSLDACEKGQDVKFSVTVTLYPEPKISGYDKIKVEVPAKKKVTKKDIDKVIQDARERLAKIEEITDRDVAQKGDVINIEIQFVTEGEQPKKPEPTTRLLGGNELSPELDEGICGMKIGEKKDIPRQLSEKAIEEGAKPSLYRVELKKLYKRIIPELNDEFVAGLEIEDFKTVADWEADVKKHLEEDAERTYNDSIHEKALEALREVNKFKVPQAMVDFEIKQMVRNVYASNGQEPQISDKDIETYRGALGEIALKRIELGVIVDRIAEQEKIEATDEDIENFCQKFAAERQIPIDTVKQYVLRDNLKEQTVGEIKRDKVLDFLREHADVKIAKEESEGKKDK